MLLPQLAAVDTLFVRQIPPVRTAFEQVVFVASGITSLLALVLVVVVLVALAALRAKANDTRTKLDALLVELQPIAKNATAMSQDVREVATTAKVMVVESRDTVRQANERIRETVDNLAQRVDELSEMLGSIHRAGERVAAVAGTAIGGIKAGARVFGLGKKRRKKRSRNDAERPRLRQRS